MILKTTVLLLLTHFLLEVGSNGLTARIIGGAKAKPGQFPYVVSFELYPSFFNRTPSFWCGGSIIHKRFVLTAAHCVYLNGKIDAFNSGYKYLLVKAGGLHRSQTKEPTQQIRLVVDYKVHKKFNSWNLSNDIAVLKLSKDFDLKTRYVKSISLAPPGYVSADSAILSGWGKTGVFINSSDYSNLEFTSVRILSQKTCKSDLREKDGSQICSYMEGHGMCNGDSGGPLAVKSKTRDLLVGVVSYHPPVFSGGEWKFYCGIKPDVYTSVAYYSKWITKAVHNLQ